MKERLLKKRRRDKSDRNTVDKVLDKKTLKILERLQERGMLINLQGSLCTGKEANIYLAEASMELHSKFIKSNYAAIENMDGKKDESDDGSDKNVKFSPVAIKIFKTSAMQFKDRERYIRGEKRFKTFCVSNSRKLVKLWAEKEVRNLKRLNKAGIPAPKPVYLKRNVLIMTLIGSDGVAAPKLRDAEVYDGFECYMQCVDIMKRMYSDTKLIHADLSEFNLLYLDNAVYVIDVGQSVETSHENAQRFLIMDINNINDFFRRRGVEVVCASVLFEEITGIEIPQYLRDANIHFDSFIPSRVDEAWNQEDLAMFAVPMKNAQHVDESREKSYEEDVLDLMDAEPESSCIVDTGKESDRKVKKKQVKELNKVRRATRISKKEKKRIFKKYIGGKKQRR